MSPGRANRTWGLAPRRTGRRERRRGGVASGPNYRAGGGAPGGDGGGLWALPDLRRGQGVCEVEAAPQEPLRTHVAGARYCRSNASRVLCTPLQAGMEGPNTSRDLTGQVT